jgi:hypothetical protein
MSTWKWILPVLILAALAYLYTDEKQFVEKARPRGFSTDAPAGSLFSVRLESELDLKKVRVNQTIRFLPAKAIPYGSTTAALLPADTVIEARVKRVLISRKGRYIILFEFERLRAGGRAVPLSAFLTIKNRTPTDEETRREVRGSLGALIARSALDNPLIVLAGYLSGTYTGDFLSRRTNPPASFFSNELGQTIPVSIPLQLQLHRRAFIPR